MSGTGTIISINGTIIKSGSSTTVNPNLFIDWYMPSKFELLQMYTYLHAFGVGNFSAELYFSSTESTGNANSADTINFTGGFQGAAFKSTSRKVRPSRNFVSPKTFNLRDEGPAGGLIFYIIDLGNGTFRYFEAAPTDLGTLQWSNITDTFVGGLSAFISKSYSNTLKIIEQPGHTISAASQCLSYEYNK